MFSAMYAWINRWANSRQDGDLRRHHAHFDVTVMIISIAFPLVRLGLLFCIFAIYLKKLSLKFPSTIAYLIICNVKLFNCLLCCTVTTIHYNDLIISAIESQIVSPTIVYSTVYSGRNQRKHQNSASLAFVRGINRWPVNSSHKGPVTRKMFFIWWRHHDILNYRASSMFAPSQWETALFCNDVSHWVGASLGSAMNYITICLLQHTRTELLPQKFIFVYWNESTASNVTPE